MGILGNTCNWSAPCVRKFVCWDQYGTRYSCLASMGSFCIEDIIARCTEDYDLVPGALNCLDVGLHGLDITALSKESNSS